MRTAMVSGSCATFLVGVALLAQSGSASVTQIPGCAPQCLEPALTRPGNLPAGKYKTKHFFAGQMTASFPKGWFSEEDSTGEFAVWARSKPNAKLLFWEDVHAVSASQPLGTWKRVGPLRRTSSSLLSWLQANRNVAVSRPAPDRIGKIRARVIDVRVSDQAVNDDPGCPAKACANFVQFPQWDGPYGIAGTKAVTRVMIETSDGGDRTWSTVGVSTNVIDASYIALNDSLTYKLWKSGRRG